MLHELYKMMKIHYQAEMTVSDKKRYKLERIYTIFAIVFKLLFWEGDLLWTFADKQKGALTMNL